MNKKDIATIINLAKTGMLPQKAADVVLYLNSELTATNATHKVIVDSMNKEIVEKNQQIDEMHKEISGMSQEIIDMTKEIENLKARIAELELLKKLARSEKFAPSSEQLLLNLFPEAEAIEQNAEEEFEDNKKKVKEYERKTKKEKKAEEKRTICSVPANTPVTDVYHTENATDSLSVDGIEYKRVEDLIINKLAVIPAKVVVERHHYPQYKATVETEVGEDARKILWEEKETDGIAASPSLVADIIVSKFDDHMPLYRQEERYMRDGIHISRQKMAMWIIKHYDKLIPFMKRFKDEIYACPFINKDETSVQVLDVKNNQGKPSSNLFMNVTLGSRYIPQERRFHRLAYYEYTESRKTNVINEDYWRYHYSGFVMTDGLKQYLKMESTHHSVCWTHAVRAFKNIYKIDKNNKHVVKVLALHAELSRIEDELRAKLLSGEIDADEFLSERKRRCTKVIDDIFEFVATIKKLYEGKDKLMINAINYLETYRENLYTYLNCIEATPDNNAAERAIKPFVLGRKAWLFAQTVDGIDASATFFSLVETAKLSSLNVRDYLEYVLTFAPISKTKEEIEALLPWNADLSRLDEVKAKRASATMDKTRKQAYILNGNTAK